LLTQEQDNVTNQLEQLESRLEAWSQATFGQPTWWDFTSNITTTPSISSAQEKTVPLPILRARYDYYYIVLDRSFGVHNYVYADYLLNFANSQLSNNNIYPGSGPSGGLGPVPQAANLPQTHQALASARSAMVAACSAKNGLPWFGN